MRDFFGNEKGERVSILSRKLEESVAVCPGCWLWFFSRHEHLVWADETRLFPCISWNTCDNTRHHCVWLCLRWLVCFFFPPVIVEIPTAFTIFQSSFSSSPRPFAWLLLYSCAKLCPNLMSVFETRLIDAKDLKRLLYTRQRARLFIWNLKSLRFYSMKSLVKRWRCVPIKTAFCPLS